MSLAGNPSRIYQATVEYCRIHVVAVEPAVEQDLIEFNKSFGLLQKPVHGIRLRERWRIGRLPIRVLLHRLHTQNDRKVVPNQRDRSGA